MIRITDKSKCTGCTACITSCPRQCIVMRRDRQGFDYPVANPDLCIGCGLCESVCPVLNPRETSAPLAAYAARADEHVAGSSSGGVFPRLAADVVGDGGLVFGAVMNPDLTVGHSEADTMDEVMKMTGSKYVQSDMYSVLEDVKTYLEAGRKVLFSGTPCQIAGLNAFLGKEYGNLISVDVACHGVPGPGLWEKYAAALSRKYGAAIDEVRFRDKSSGWRRYSFTVKSAGMTVSVPYVKDPFMALFIQDMTLRPSCYSCPARDGRSGSDITLADLWNVAEAAPAFDDDRGVSLVLANSDKGMKLLEGSGLALQEVDKEIAVRKNSGFSGSIPCPERRDEFFAGIHSTKDIISYMSGFVVRTWSLKKFCERIHTLLSKIKRRIAR